MDGKARSNVNDYNDKIQQTEDTDKYNYTIQGLEEMKKIKYLFPRIDCKCMINCSSWGEIAECLRPGLK